MRFLPERINDRFADLLHLPHTGLQTAESAASSMCGGNRHLGRDFTYEAIHVNDRKRNALLLASPLLA
jgi:hypothetical protein